MSSNRRREKNAGVRFLDLTSDQKSKRTFFKGVRDYFREYCRCTTIHGFKYFGEKRTCFERFWWFLTFSACIFGLSITLYAVYKKWDSNAVIVTFDSKATPIYETPFPAVTICPEVKFQLNKLKKNNSKSGNIKKYKGILCGEVKNNKSTLNIDYSSDAFYKILDKTKPNFLMKECTFYGKNCTSSFVKLITDEGICYTFNFLDRNEIFNENVKHYSNFHFTNMSSGNWSLEDGYENINEINTYPKRALLSGTKHSLKVTLVTTVKRSDLTCGENSHGYKVSLHIPLRFPRPSEDHFKISLNQDVLVAVSPSMISSYDKVKIYNQRRRECYFRSERKLKYFKIYSSLNCKFECLTNMTLKHCKCVTFFMPRENNTRICDLSKIKCVKNITERYQKLALRKFQSSNHSFDSECQCRPICTDLNYNVEVTQSAHDTYHQIKDTFNSTTTLTIYFKTGHFISTKRCELYGYTDFLANFGGLLGLFTGFSVLSLMEILYFLSIRLICNRKLYGHWAGKEQ